MDREEKPRRTVPLADFKADPGKVTQMAADSGPISIVNPSGETVWRVSVPKAEPEDC